MSRSVRKVLSLSACGGAVLALSGIFSAAAPYAAAAKKLPFTIDLSNSYIGNGWRVEMEHILEAEAATPPWNKLVRLKIYNSGNNASAQISQIDDMIASGVDAILVNAASPTALNPVIAQAHAHHIVVVSFDNVVTSPYAWKVDISQYQFGVTGATWLVHALHGKGNIILNRGVPGTPVDLRRYQGAMSVFRKYPGIKILDSIYGMWDAATSETKFASALAAYPKIDGVWSEGGTYGIVQAMLRAHRHLVPMAGEASNGFRLALARYHNQGLTGISIGDPPLLSALAMQVAVRILEGQHLPKKIIVPAPTLTWQQIKIGVNAFPKLPPTFYDDFVGDGVKVSVHGALTGQP